MGSFFGVQDQCHPRILHPIALEEVVLSGKSAEIGLCEGFHPATFSPPFPAQFASQSTVNRTLSHSSLWAEGEGARNLRQH